MLVRNGKTYDKVIRGGKIYNKMIRNGKTYGGAAPEPDPSLQPGFSFRDTYRTNSQEYTSPISAVNHILDVSNEGGERIGYLPNLMLPKNTACEVVFAFDVNNTDYSPKAIADVNNDLAANFWENSVSNIRFDIGLSEGALYWNEAGGHYNTGNVVSQSDLYGIERTVDNRFFYIKYSGGIKTRLYENVDHLNDDEDLPDSNLYIKFVDQRANKISFLQYKGAVLVDDKPDVERAEINQYVDNAFYAADAIVQGGGPLTNGAVIASIPDALTDKVLPYAGVESPSLGRPYWLNDSIVFQNESGVLFRGYDASYPNPQEMTWVGRMMPGQPFEAISTDNYIGFGVLGPEGATRLGGSTNWIDQLGAPNPFEITVIHVKITKEGDTFTHMVWFNGVYKGKYVGTDGWTRGSIEIGVGTNAADNDFIAKFYKQGIRTDEQRAGYFNKLNEYFNAGALPDLNLHPYATDIYATRSEDDYTAHYTYNGVNPEDVSAVEYRWYQRIGASFTYNLIGTTKTVTYTGTEGAIRPTVKVYDNQGNAWRFINGEFYL